MARRSMRWRSACRLLGVDLTKVRVAFDRRCCSKDGSGKRVDLLPRDWRR